MRPARGQERGQGLIETSIGMLVMVTIIVAGIHLAEVMSISVKMPMIAQAVMFDATAHSLYQAGADPTANQINARFPREVRDLDLRSSTANAPPFRALFTSVEPPVRVTTAAYARVDRPTQCSYPPNDPYAPVPASLDSGFMLLVNPAFNVTSLRTRHFLEGNGGFFKEDLLLRSGYQLCAIGKSRDGRCDGTFKIMLDDRALHYEDASNEWDRLECVLYGCGNQEMKKGGERHFAGGNGAASALATAVLGSSPVKEDEFWLSFRDADSSFTENGFKTGPGPATRTPCYLGVACP